jgi:hypothetical protein
MLWRQVSNLPMHSRRLPSFQRFAEFQFVLLPLISGRKGPLIAIRDQAGFHRIAFDIQQNAFQFFHISDPVVVRLMLPKRSFPAQHLIALSSREQVHAVDDLFSRRPVAAPLRDLLFAWVEYPVEMAGHDDKPQQIAAQSREVEKGIHDNAREPLIF